jgi:amino acid transporter
VLFRSFVCIILFAHVISITTGFSVSSIATDKKIKAGGIYYMLTRSLGFPIGGAIGITLFVATALSISLYLIGFAESMLPVIQELFGIQEITVNHFRLVGSIALMVVLFVAYVSTSFAIKIQYVILVLIGLSLISIFTGSSEGLKKGTDLVSNPNFAVLFGIFFPAVTGFTAGVAMSGDLKNPSKSIPWGTMLAIFTGLAVYLALAFFLNASIDKDILTTNNNVLIQFGSIAFLVVAGVWGATLSSALGGILGGPRILQAMSLDNIAPKIFGIGHGVNNEPRNALILTFIISELGILIGDLNVIAEIVAMFYMAAYLFINISCFLEQWASPDFRPKLKIPLWVSFVGAITTFLLMVQLN